jgi:hypothetical protein
MERGPFDMLREKNSSLQPCSVAGLPERLMKKGPHRAAPVTLR